MRARYRQCRKKQPRRSCNRPGQAHCAETSAAVAFRQAQSAQAAWKRKRQSGQRHINLRAAGRKCAAGSHQETARMYPNWPKNRRAFCLFEQNAPATIRGAEDRQLCRSFGLLRLFGLLSGGPGSLRFSFLALVARWFGFLGRSIRSSSVGKLR